MKKIIPSITLATVYRNLNLLAEQNKILRLEINHEYHYDYFTKPHIHFISEKDGKIYDIEDEKLLKEVTKKVVDKNFIPKKIDIFVRGEYH